MAKYPMIQLNDAAQQVTDTFGGLNRALKIREGEWNEELNLTSDQYPMLAVRKPRSLSEEYDRIVDMVKVGDTIYYITPSANADETVLQPAGIAMPGAGKELIMMGAYIFVAGCNWWYNTSDGTNGSVDAILNVSSETITDDEYRPYVLRYFPCDAEGNELRVQMLLSVEAAAALEANDSQTEVDPGDCYAIGSEKRIRKYRANATDPEPWVTMPHYLRIEAVGIGGIGLREGDYVEVSGLPTEWTEGVYLDDVAWDTPDPGMIITHNRNGSFDDNPNGYRKVKLVGEGFIVVENVFCTRNVAASYVAAEGASVGRKVPDMDFIIEAQNRLWGCKYGKVDGEMINEIYASSLGDFKNWRQYDGTSMASYTAPIGAPGRWTGAINYNGSPLFFKEDRMYKVYVSAYGAHQIKDHVVEGVMDGMQKSLCILDDRVYYMGVHGVQMYDGSTPRKISGAVWGKSALVNKTMMDCVAAAADEKVYFCINDIDLGLCYLVYDVRAGIWHRESAGGSIMSARNFSGVAVVAEVAANSKSRLVYLNDEYGRSTDGPVEWSCTSGLIGYGDPEQKYVSRFDLRLHLGTGATVQVWIEYDSSGTWDKQAELSGTGTGSVMIPVRPRRCDHFRIRMTGKGEMAMFSFAKKYAKGSDVV